MQFKPDTPGPATAAPAAPLPALHIDRFALGMAASVGSMFMLNTMNMFAKLLSDKHQPVEVAFYRNAIAVMPFLALIYMFGRRDLLKINGKPYALLARSVIGTLSLVATFKAFNYLPMADAQSLLFTSSFFIPVLGYFFLKEPVGPYRWAAVAAGFVGMLIIVRPTGAVSLTGVSLAVTAAFLQAMLGTLLRHLGRTERPETVAFYFLLIGTVLMALGMPFVATVPTWSEAPYFLGAGVSGALAQLLLSVAYKYAPAALVVVFSYTGIVWATAYGWFIWGDWPGTALWIGASVIITSSLLIVWREHRAARRAHRGG